MNIFEQLSKYNIVYKKAGESDRSSMPLGNGEIGANFWVVENKELQFYFSRSDSIENFGRNLKLGMGKIEISPNPFVKGMPFKQELSLEDGCIKIVAGEKDKEVSLKIFIDKESDNIYIVGSSKEKIKIKASYYNWRKSNSDENDCYDTIKCEDNGILFYYRAGITSVPELAKLEALDKYIDKIYDPFDSRVFGGFMIMSNSTSKKVSDNIFELNSNNDANEFSIIVSSKSEQTKDINLFINDLVNYERVDSEIAFSRTANWWKAYWSKSFIFVKENEKGKMQAKDEIKSLDLERSDIYVENEGISYITRAYILTKFMFACNSTGKFPLYFNGLLFNTMPGNNSHYVLSKIAESHTAKPIGEPRIDINPDERCWSCNVLWQNVRLPYYSMLERNELEEIKVLFQFYRRFWDINKIKAQVYYNAEGQYNTEITMFSGLQHPWIYGEDRTGKPDGYSANRWGGAVDISPGLELTYFMLKFYNHTKDYDFLHNELLPYAKDILLYVKTRFKERENGKIKIYPLNCIETFWDTKNPITVVAGMHAVLNNILELPETLNIDKEFYKQMLAMTPEIPKETIDNKVILAPADEFNNDTQNVETVTLYTVYPFENYTFYKDNKDLAINSYNLALKSNEKIFKPRIIGETPSVASYSGWQYIGMTAALLGLKDDAKEVLLNNSVLSNPGYPFPAFWGPVYDSVPDVDHGANILNTLQLMAFKVENEKIYILPCWEKEWDISFKLYADKDTTVELEFKNGKIEKLEVTPKTREKDIVIMLS